MQLNWVVGYLIAIVVGVCLRIPLEDWSTRDYFTFLLPWYEYARLHGVSALAVDFTNYAPFYSYLLLAATQFDALAPPLTLIKAISFVFELGNAAMAAALVTICSSDRKRALIAFALVWIAPTVLYNGAAWAQADSIWTFFLLVSITLFASGRNGTVWFGMAFAVKAQALFLGPYVLGMLARGGISRILWLATVPVVYMIFALPVLFAGRSVGDVALIYGRQADYFNELTMNAGSLWALLPRLPYTTGTIIGLVLAASAGMWLAREIATSTRRDPTYAVLAAGASLLLMPFLLPKMHDRYFYAFEIIAIILACIRTRYLVFAAISQVDGVLSYLAFDQNIRHGIRLAAIGNVLMLFFIIRELKRESAEVPFAKGPWALYAALLIAIASFLPWTIGGLSGMTWKLGYAVLIIATAVVTTLLLRRSLVAQ